MRGTHPGAIMGRPMIRRRDRAAAELVVPVLLGVFLSIAGPRAAAAACSDLLGLSLDDATVTLAEMVAAGRFTPPAGVRGRGGPGGGSGYADLPAFCRVAATLRPTPDSDIKIEVWLPTMGWNGKFLVAGNGGWAGSISHRTLADGLRRGYAVANTDTGHEGGTGSFILGHPEKLIDFADRAVHETTVAGKALAAAYYERAPRRSYFQGCSTGGRQAMTAAQRHPDDFDGIVAGAPAIHGSHQTAGQIWAWAATNQATPSFIPPEKYQILHQAVLAACDARDGVTDGVLEDPRRCDFDPRVVQCESGREGANCLSGPQVEAARRIYAGPVHPRTGESLFPGFEAGSELGWAASSGPRPVSYASDFYKYVVFEDADWDPLTLDYDADVARAGNVGTALIAIDPDLGPLVDRGSKLIMYHGWADPGIPPGYLPQYYEQVVTTLGESRAADGVRLYMVPGMGHCGGGEGTSQFDMLAALDAWVERGEAPSRIEASRVRDGRVDRTRPLCPYPLTAVYRGTGSTDATENFVCR